MPNSFDLPPELIDALIQQESNYNPNAVNKTTGARGLGQIMPPALRDFNRYTKKNYTYDDMFIPHKNREVTEWYLYQRIPQMLRYYKLPINIENVLTSYNFGIGNVKK